MSKTRYELLGCIHHESPNELVQTFVNDYRGMANYPKEWSASGIREDEVFTSLSLAVLQHLGFSTPAWLPERINEGFNAALDYFFGTWHRHLDPRDYGPNEKWFQTFSRGLFLGLLTERWEDVAKLCSFARSDLPAEYLGDEIEWEGTLVYLSIAADLRPEPLDGLEDVEAKINKCKRKRPRLLFKAWEAARARDQAAFNKAIKESLKHFDGSYFAPRLHSMIDWIAEHQTVIVLAAMRLGLKFPDLPERLAAMIVTRESLGLEPKAS